MITMLEEAARLKLLEEQFDKKYEWTFCINPTNDIHVYGPENLKEMAKILNVPVKIKPFKERKEDDVYLGIICFDFTCGGRKWEVYAHYTNESEVVV